MTVSVLHVRPENATARLDADAIPRSEVTVTEVSTVGDALATLESRPVDCVVIEETVGSDGGLEGLAAVRSECPDVPVVLCSERPDGTLASEATRYDLAAYHVHESEESLAERLGAVLGAGDRGSDAGQDPADQSGTRPIPDGTAITHGTPFQSIAETLNDAVVTIDAESTIHFANEALTELTGYDHGDLIGESFTMVMPERYHEAHEAAVSRYAETRERTLDWDYIELAVSHRDGTEIPVAVSFSQFERDGTLFFTGVLRDITERKRYTRALSDLHETTKELLRATTVEDVTETAVEATSRILGYHLNTVRLYDPDTETLRPVAVSDDTSATMGDRPDYDPDTWGQGEAFQSGETVVYEDLSEFEPEGGDVGPNPDAYAAVESSMFVPIGDRGVLSIGATDTGAFDDQSRSLAELLASNAAVALDRVERQQELITYETVLETFQDMVYVLEPDGTFSLVTDPLAEWLGYDRSRMDEIDPAEVVATEDLPEFQEKIERLWHTDAESVTVETELIAADGTVYPAEIEVSLYPTDDSFEGTIGVVRDLTELRETRRQLETERDRFTYLFNTMPDAVVEVVFEDDVPIVESTNDAFEELFGYEEEAVIGRSINEVLLPPEYESEGREIDTRIASDDEWIGEIRRETADGLRYFLFRGVPYRGRDGEQRAFGIYTDITERKHRERRLQVLSRVLRHNLRNDLTVVQGYAEEIEDAVRDRDSAEMAATLREKAREVAELSERARRIQKTMDKEAGPEHTVDLATHLDRLVEEYRPVESGSITVEVPDSLTVTVDERFDLAIRNLVENALEHGGESPRVRVAASTRDADLVVTVSDDGPGIPDIEWEVVTGAKTVTQLTHASGLGLWAIKWAAESFGGRLRRGESSEDGTEVTLVLPGLVVA